MNIPISQPTLTPEDKHNLVEAFDSGWISSIGENLRKFESSFASYIGTKYCLAVSNGTTALELALSTIDKRQDRNEIIIPSFTFAAVANAVIATGFVPVPVDVSLESWNITNSSIEIAISERTAALIVVHSYGNPVEDINLIKNLCKSRGVLLIEDCAEAHGATFGSAKVGSLSDISCFSFYGNKIITCGEGGAVLTSSETLYRTMACKRDHGMSKTKRYFHEMPGFNYRMTNLQAAILISQLKRIDQILYLRHEQQVRYDQHLEHLGFTRAAQSSGNYSVNWLYTVKCPNHVNITLLVKLLASKGIDTRPVFNPISTFPYINAPYSCSNSLDLSKQCLSLPTFTHLSLEEIDGICAVLQDCLFSHN